MAHFTRRFFLQSLLAIPVVACSKRAEIDGIYQDFNLSQFNIPLPVETLGHNLKVEYRREAQDFYNTYSFKSNFNEQFEKLELEQFQNEQVVFLDGMAVTHLMVGFILMARQL